MDRIKELRDDIDRIGDEEAEYLEEVKRKGPRISSQRTRNNHRAIIYTLKWVLDNNVF